MFPVTGRIRKHIEDPGGLYALGDSRDYIAMFSGDPRYLSFNGPAGSNVNLPDRGTGSQVVVGSEPWRATPSLTRGPHARCGAPLASDCSIQCGPDRNPQSRSR
jgi:hypothetical protein